MAGYQPGRGPGRARPDRYRGRGPGSHADDDRARSGGFPWAAPRRDDVPRGDPQPGYGAAGGRGGPGYPGGGAGGYPPSAADGGYRRRVPYQGQGRPGRRDVTGGADGNERLTAITGAALLLLLAAEGFTLLAIHQLLTAHFFIGMLLVGPVALKAASTLYRFTRYYTGAADYRRKGPPAPLLRLLGPFVLLLSVAVIGSGIMLGVTGPGGAGQTWLFLHKAAFVLWFLAMSVHVLTYIWRLPRLISGDLAGRAGARARDVLAGRPARWLLLTASVLVGLALAASTAHLSGAWASFSGGGG